MKLRSSIILATIPIALLLQGCGILGIHPKNTVKAEADFLETISIGTSYERIVVDAEAVGLPFSRLNPENHLHYFACLAVTPDDSALYRQWPKGILLNVNDDDMYCRGGVCDNAGNAVAKVDVFFDGNHRFKGYCAFSDAPYSRDDKARYKQENQQFHELNLDKISVLAAKWFILAQERKSVENGLPSLPLSNWMQTNLPAIQTK